MAVSAWVWQKFTELTDFWGATRLPRLGPRLGHIRHRAARQKGQDMASNPRKPLTFRHLPNALDPAAQVALRDAIHQVLADAPPFQPAMPRTGKPFSVRMSNCGPLGWVSDKAGGYRYQATHPVSGLPWPAMPEQLLALWREVARCPALPEACLINLYDGTAKMGSHQDRDEADFSSPVLSVSLGDEAVFHVGGLARGDPKVRLTLRSGDVLVLEGESRLAFHGIDRVLRDTSLLLPEGGRINLTLRRVTKVG
jgi:DNA oxidative demethylase